jgi:hypothetical protein
MRTSHLVVVLGICIGFAHQSAFAQPPQAYQTQPAVSPYLNLTRAGGNMANNYFNLVRPQIDFRNSIQSLQTQVDNISPTSQSGAPGELPTTGHKVQFMNTAKYFGSMSGNATAPRSAGVYTAPRRTSANAQTRQPGTALLPTGP